VFNGWPAGSLLILRGHPPFRLRGFEGGPSPVKDIDFVVLDGQQRLSALYQAIYGTGKHVYALEYSAPLEGGQLDLEEAIVSIDRVEWDERYDTLRAQLTANLVPLFTLTSASDFFAWRDLALEAAPRADRDNLKEALTGLYRQTLSRVHSYQFPVVVLERTFEPASLAQIFDRVNRYGLRLSAFDLMVVQLYEPDWNLRDKWEIAQGDYPVIARFLDED